jgi:hypothetical protein
MKECIMKAAVIVCSEKQQFFKKFSLSANPMAEHSNDFAGDTQCQIKEKCKNFVAYSFAIDKSTMFWQH